jgi:hypothetical protein
VHRSRACGRVRGGIGRHPARCRLEVVQQVEFEIVDERGVDLVDDAVVVIVAGRIALRRPLDPIDCRIQQPAAGVRTATGCCGSVAAHRS